MNNSQKRAIVRAYDQGMTLSNIAKLFKSSYQSVVSIVHDYKCKGVRYV
jgi:transposase